MVKLTELKKLEYFNGLKDEDLVSIAARLSEKTVSKNHNVILEGSKSRELYIVASGRVKVFKTSLEGREHIFYYADRGQTFGESSIFDREPSPVSATAVTETKLYVLRGMELKKLLKKIPDLAEVVLVNYSQRIRKLIQMVEGLSFKNVPGRLAGILLDMVNKEGVVKGDNIVLKRNITLYEMASMVGTVREVITRSLQELEKKGYLNVHRRQIEIVDLEALKKIS